MLPEDITATNDEMLKSLHINTKLFQLKGFRQDVAISTAFILGNHQKSIFNNYYGVL